MALPSVANVIVKKVLSVIRARIEDEGGNKAQITSSGELKVYSSFLSSGATYMSGAVVDIEQMRDILSAGVHVNVDDWPTDYAKQATLSSGVDTLDDMESLLSTGVADINGLRTLLSSAVSVNGVLWNPFQISSAVSDISGAKNILSASLAGLGEIRDLCSAGIEVNIDTSSLATQATLSSAASELSEVRALMSAGVEVNLDVSSLAKQATLSSAAATLSTGVGYVGTIRNRLSTGVALLSSGISVKNVYPDGTNKAPSGDDISRSIFVRLTTGIPVAFEDTSFVSGDSPATHDVNAALGRNGRHGYIVNDGPGDITVNISEDNGGSWSSNITIKSGDVLSLDGMNVDQIKMTWVSNSAYRIAAW